MMQTLTHNELKWIMNALQHEADSMENPSEGMEALANHVKENMLHVKRKIEAVLENNSKRIAIK